ncbi:MAG: MCP four helix bundle domain-containing protein [Desulfovibrio sp.]
MTFFTNMRLTPKILLSFISTLILMILLSLFSLMELNKLKQSADEMADNWLPCVRYTSALNTNTSDFRILELDHVASTSESQMLNYEKKWTICSSRSKATVKPTSNLSLPLKREQHTTNSWKNGKHISSSTPSC